MSTLGSPGRLPPLCPTGRRVRPHVLRGVSRTTRDLRPVRLPGNHHQVATVEQLLAPLSSGEVEARRRSTERHVPLPPHVPKTLKDSSTGGSQLTSEFLHRAAGEKHQQLSVVVLQSSRAPGPACCRRCRQALHKYRNTLAEKGKQHVARRAVVAQDERETVRATRASATCQATVLSLPPVDTELGASTRAAT